MTQIISILLKRDWKERGVLGKRSDGGLKEKLRNLYLIYNYCLKPVRQINGPDKLYTERFLF